MKTKYQVVFVGFCLLVAACVPRVSSTERFHSPISNPLATAEIPIEVIPPALSIEKMNNSILYAPVYGKNVSLTNGEFAISDENGDYSVKLLPQIALGDLNGDQVDDAAILLAENDSGSGVFVSLVAIVSKGAGFEQLDTILVDDRPIIQSLTSKDGEILLKATIHTTNDTMAESTFEVIQIYQLLESNLNLISMSSMSQGGMERSINIDFPVDRSEISNPLQIKGSMPVAPFENNLLLIVFDTSGNILYQSGFMVTAAEPGSPATFDSSLDTINLPANSWVRLELTDVSMADGSIIALDSVVVRIK